MDENVRAVLIDGRPLIEDMGAAVQLLLALDQERDSIAEAVSGGDLLSRSDTIAGYYRRRACLLVWADEQWPGQYADQAEGAVDLWQRAERDLIAHAVKAAHRPA